MKKLILSTTFLIAGTGMLLAQGQVTFSNEPGIFTDGIDRLVYMTQLGVDPVTSDQWKAQLEENRSGVWTALGAPVNFYGDFGGAYPELAGFWPDDGTRRIVSVPALTPTELRIAVLGPADEVLGYSPAFSFTQGVSTPPAPGDFLLSGFRAFVVPEPSTIALGVLGLGALLLFRRRK